MDETYKKLKKNYFLLYNGSEKGKIEIMDDKPKKYETPKQNKKPCGSVIHAYSYSCLSSIAVGLCFLR